MTRCLGFSVHFGKIGRGLMVGTIAPEVVMVGLCMRGVLVVAHYLTCQVVVVNTMCCLRTAGFALNRLETTAKSTHVMYY